MIQFNFYFEGGGGIKFKTNLKKKKKEKFPKSHNIEY
jgi:hypothetical protein